MNTSPKNIIITGTSRGIGYELVSLYTNMGHNVLAISRNPVLLSGDGESNCHCISCDITYESDLKKVSDYLKTHWKKVDILINNSGSMIKKPFSRLKRQDFLDSYDVNVFGAARVTQIALPYMDNEGHVVNISSMGGIQGSLKFPELAAYSSSKGALITLTEVLAEEYKENGPSFNVLALGAVQTEMLEEAFPGYQAPNSAEEMADFIAQFALTGQQFFNGKVLQVSSTTP